MLIGLYSSAPQSGKSTVANILTTSKHDFCVVPFAGTLKEMLRVLLTDLGLTNSQCEQALFFQKEQRLPELGGVSTRHALQTLGTEWGRQCMDRHLWTRAWSQQVQQSRCAGYECIVADDMRFLEEVEAVRALGGITVKVERDVADSACLAHASEGALDDIDFDWILVNNGSLVELEQAVHQMLAVMLERARTEAA